MKTVTNYAVVLLHKKALFATRAAANATIASRNIEGQSVVVQVDVPADVAQLGEESYIYIVRAGDDGPVKIGWTANPKARLSYLAVDNPAPLRLLALTSGSMKEEKELHRRFAEHRIRGEWYRPEKELLDFADQLMSGQLVAQLEASIGTCATGKTT
jgi:hypothetical protein